MSIKKIVVTGGSGKAGRAVVRDLVAHGYEVINVDILPSKEDLGVPFVHADLNKFSEVLEVLKGQDAVVHLAAIPAPGIKSEDETFSNNIVSTYNIFQVRAGNFSFGTAFGSTYGRAICLRLLVTYNLRKSYGLQVRRFWVFPSKPLIQPMHRSMRKLTFCQSQVTL